MSKLETITVSYRTIDFSALADGVLKKKFKAWQKFTNERWLEFQGK